jgi:hypothetical protein
VSVGNRVPAAAPRLSIAPNPAGLERRSRFAAAPGRESWRLGVFDLAGRRVRDLGRGAPVGGGAAKLRWDGRDQGRARVRAGVYQVRLESGGQTRSAGVVMLRGR